MTDKAALPVPNPLMPDPPMWPVCPTCHAPWCLRRALSITKGYGWYWSRDCKHKTVEAVLHDADGPIQVITEQPVPCGECDGAGWVAGHGCGGDERRCATECPVQERCEACHWTGFALTAQVNTDSPVQPDGAIGPPPDVIDGSRPTRSRRRLTDSQVSP